MPYLIIFITAFLSATLLPLQSEAVLVGLILQQQYWLWLLLVCASIGNILGSCVNWYLGLKIEQYKDRKWFPVSEKNMLKAEAIYQKYGYWSLLLSWVPIIGDPITLIAGLLKENFARFLLMVSIAKTGRYLFVCWVVLGVFE